MKYYQACPVEPVNGSCPDSLIWVEEASRLGMSYGDFLQILPHLVGILFTCWSIRQIVRMVFNSR